MRKYHSRMYENVARGRLGGGESIEYGGQEQTIAGYGDEGHEVRRVETKKTMWRGRIERSQRSKFIKIIPR